jgi:NAD(P)-dependent dehydrogenase (short-subunit alcohol dehydrogenase family)
MTTDTRMAGKLAVVTGGSDGIGLGIAQAFARSGADVLILSRDTHKLERAAEALRAHGTSIETLATDLSAADAPPTVVDALKRLARPLDVLVNNAGTGAFTPFHAVTRLEYDRLLALNVAAPFFLTQALLPVMRRPGASVINISSYFARKMLPGRPSAVYSLTKGALDSMTRAMAMELAPAGIRVNAIAPGTIDTELRRRTIANLPEAEQAHIAELAKRSYPLGRIGEAGDLGGMAVHLACDESRWTTGAIISVDGGLTIC